MAVRINFNSAAIRAHFNLSTVDRQLSTSLERLSSGIRIRRAVDGPAELSLANQMRHHLAGIAQATDNVSEGISMLQVAEGGMDQASNILNRARELIIGSLNDGVNDSTMLAAYQEEYDNLMRSLDGIATDTRFGNRTLLDGTLADNRLTTDARQVISAFTHDDTQLPGGILRDSTITIDPPSGDLQRAETVVTLGGGTPPTLDDTLAGQSQNGTTLTSLAGDTITLSGPEGSATVALDDSMTIRQFLGAVNAASASTGLRAAYDETSGELQIESLAFGGGAFDVQSSDVNANGAGLLDDTPADTAANGFTTDAPVQTIDVSYVDEAGVTQNVRLYQDPHVNDGLGFISTAAQAVQTFDTIAGSPPPGTTPLLNLTVAGAGFDFVPVPPDTTQPLDNETITITGNEGTATISLDSSWTINDLVQAINDESQNTGVEASYADGSLTVRQTLPNGGNFDIQSSNVNGNTLGLLDDSHSSPLDTTNGLIDRTVTDPDNYTFRLDVRDTSDGALDSSISTWTDVHEAQRTGTTDLQIGALTGQTRTVEVPDIRAGALGHSGRANDSNIDDLREIVDRAILESGSIEEREDALRVLDAAIEELSSARGEVGALISSGLESTLDTLRITNEQLSSSESLLRDTDFAEESANFARHNIVFQAATSMLAQANQIPQSILQLLG